MTEKKIISTDRAPAAIGPYSQAVESEGLLFCSGQVPLDPQSGELLQGTITEEATRALENLGAVLEAGGTSFERVVKVTAFLTDMGDFVEFNEVYAKYFGEGLPARATVEVSGLPKGARIEVECIARTG